MEREGRQIGGGREVRSVMEEEGEGRRQREEEGERSRKREEEGGGIYLD